jgi:hypothetical protein
VLAVEAEPAAVDAEFDALVAEVEAEEAEAAAASFAVTFSYRNDRTSTVGAPPVERWI